MRRRNQFRWLLIFLLLVAPMARAHVGSPDVVVQMQAGPYPLLVSVQPASVVPGVAQIQVQSNAEDISGVSVAPTPLTGEAAQHPPVAEELQRAPGHAIFYSGNVWLMSSGAWQLHITVHGGRGDGEISVPVPSVATGTLPMPLWLTATLVLLGSLLVLGMAAMVGAALREAKLAPGVAPDGEHVRRARWGIVATLALLIGVLALGGWWWSSLATTARKNLYKPLQMEAALDGNRMKLEISLPDAAMHDANGSATQALKTKINPLNWVETRRLDDLLPDHGHIMHLYMVRQPQMDVLLHLHPQQTGVGEFVQQLPPMPSGEYTLYADVVHEDGFAETVVGDIGLPQIVNAPRLSGDDAMGMAEPLMNADWLATSETLPDGYTMAFDRPPVLQRGVPVLLHFELQDAKGKPAADSVDYMGMRGHAAIIKVDGTVFAHIHPFGSASMTALMIANPVKDEKTMPGMQMDTASVKTVERAANVAVFPYSFPTAGSYRIVVQMKHGDVVETGVFDVAVD